jgi:Tfp pilus assembly protein PilW
MTREGKTPESGFSLIELVIAMAVTMAAMGIAVSMLVSLGSVRTRENLRSEALADAQRALNIMTREIANSGFGLTNNGIVTGDSDSSSIRIRANLNAFDGAAGSNATSDPGEDIKYTMDSDPYNNYLIRYDVNEPVAGKRTTVLANELDALTIKYYANKVSYTSDTNDCNIAITTAGATEVADRSTAGYIIIVACVKLPEVGAPGSPGHQSASVVKLVSDVELRNAVPRNY